MAKPEDLKPGARVRLSRPTRNTERNALARHGDTWEIFPGIRGTTSDGEVLVASLARTGGSPNDLRWWRLADVEMVD